MLGKFDEAYPYFQFLERRYPKMEDLAPSYEKYQFAIAAAAYKQGRYEESLGILLAIVRSQRQLQEPGDRAGPRGRQADPASIRRRRPGRRGRSWSKSSTG